jgi:hypothetical protein
LRNAACGSVNSKLQNLRLTTAAVNMRFKSLLYASVGFSDADRAGAATRDAVVENSDVLMRLTILLL